MNKLFKTIIKTFVFFLLFLNAEAFADSQIYYIHTDHLGTPQVMTDQNQNVVWDIDQTPFGETVNESGSVVQPMRFPGQYSDPETGYSYNYYRDYDPSLGRYVQSDPIGLRGGLNTYAYVGGNPISRIDPTGEVLLCLVPGIGWAVCGSAASAAAAATVEACALVGTAAYTAYQTAKAWGAYNESDGGDVSNDEGDDSEAYDDYWDSLTDRAPERSNPYDVIPRYDENGDLKGATTYDEKGNRHQQHEWGDNVRHGEGYHDYDNSGSNGGFGKGSRGDHISY
ncbi:hypothetical protein BTA51_02165 [Hahella sp. CCB-MM4]|uniref:RHS repeat-associated core domain-containing protein n=1 Tax=Hahella sp. (strain CCB-MM4) TaxID=1926491 RepID=UPI000B9A541F|nr:RHS repeat-associated core domain-containing protein [Hahella sp. CCB-MM4]OZG75211.1 hypothetical protein BTA51_02165 [Hahella sp. CCB-MM4]